MPVITNERGMKVIEFGTGDILIHRTKTDSPIANGLCFKEHASRVIGERTEEYAGQLVEEHTPDVQFVFHKRESIDVLIEMLQEIKDGFHLEGSDPTARPSEAEADKEGLN